MRAQVHVHQHRLRQGLPPIIVRTYKGPKYYEEVEVEGKCKIVWRDRPLSCGARVWIEVEDVKQVRGKEAGK